MVNDAWLDKFDCAVIISNDIDLTEAVKLVKNQLNKNIGLVLPGEGHPSKKLMKHADFIKKIRRGILKNSQLPNPIPNSNTRKPEDW